MARKICNHPVFPSLRAKLVARNIHECPTCRVRLHIREIEETQAALERRGGIFASRAAAIAAEEPKDEGEKVVHELLVRRWRGAKMGLYKDLCLFEELRIEGVSKTRWGLQLDKAFGLWEEVKDECCRIPGYKYTEEAVDDAEDGEGSTLLRDVEYTLKQDMTSEEGGDADGGWQTVRPKARPTKQFSGEATPAKAPHTSREEGTNLKVQDHYEIMQETKVPSKIERGSYWDGRNRFDLLRDIRLDEGSALADSLEGKAASQIPDGPEIMEDAPTRPATRTPLASSPLKRKRSCTSPSKSRSRKGVHMADKVIVICDAHSRNRTGLSLQQSSYTRPHFSHTTAEAARRRSQFYRRSTRYVPSTWALSGDYENVNTSHYKTDWAAYDAITAMQSLSEKEERGT